VKFPARHWRAPAFEIVNLFCDASEGPLVHIERIDTPIDFSKFVMNGPRLFAEQVWYFLQEDLASDFARSIVAQHAILDEIDGLDNVLLVS
jgi:hypothetical protein